MLESGDGSFFFPVTLGRWGAGTIGWGEGVAATETGLDAVDVVGAVEELVSLSVLSDVDSEESDEDVLDSDIKKNII